MRLRILWTQWRRRRLLGHTSVTARRSPGAPSVVTVKGAPRPRLTRSRWKSSPVFLGIGKLPTPPKSTTDFGSDSVLLRAMLIGCESSISRDDRDSLLPNPAGRGKITNKRTPETLLESRADRGKGFWEAGQGGTVG